MVFPFLWIGSLSALFLAQGHTVITTKKARQAYPHPHLFEQDGIPLAFPQIFLSDADDYFPENVKRKPKMPKHITRYPSKLPSLSDINQYRDIQKFNGI